MGLWQSEKESARQGFVGLWESSDKLNPVIKIPLITSTIAAIGNVSPTFARNSTATYIDKDGVLQTAAINVPRFQNGRYLCEPAGTNLFLQSGTPATQVITVVSGTVYTVQCYGSGSITLSGAGTGTLVEGAPITFAASSTSLTCTVSGILNRVQVETGTKATSYIPTTTVPMGRVADVLYYTVGDVITQGQGSLYCEFWDGNISSVLRRVLNISDNTLNNRIFIYISSGGLIQVAGSTDGVSTIVIGQTAISSELNKAVLTYENNSVNLYVNGTLRGSDLSCIMPTNFIKLNIGCGHDGLTQLNGEIGNIKYFKEILTPAEAIKLTTL